LLRDPAFTDEHRPDFVLRVGELPTSKPLRTWLAALADVPQIAFDPDHTWHDPASVVGMRIHSLPPQPEEIEVEPGWLESWRAADAAAADAIDETLGDDLSEPLVARKLGEWLPSVATLFVASSMPIRDVEEFVAVRDDPPRILSNRGANGIDGTVSSAFGAAAASDGPVVLLIGDVALAHDIGGLLAARRLQIPLTIVLLNNDGGGIFHFLPVATQTDAFEEHVATPHGLDFERAAALYGCGYDRPGTEEELRAALDRALPTRGVSMIELRTDRALNRSLHGEVAERISPTRRREHL
jgi:2-succinyl-5-enolpyruvyl-6-hydroxy-3-cyclohexene-1-carboxylate synthase